MDKFFLSASILFVISLFAATGLAEEQTGGTSPVNIEFRIAQTEPCDGCQEFRVDQGLRRYYLLPDVESFDQHIISGESDQISSIKNDKVSYNFSLYLSDQEKERIRRLAENNVGKHLAVVINGKLIMAPLIGKKSQKDAVPITHPGTRKSASEKFEFFNQSKTFSKEKASASDREG